jgi:stress-induced morphogen
MDPSELEQMLEEGLPDAEVEVTRPRGPDDEDHLAARVVSPAFEGRTLVEQHDMVYDVLGDRMTRDLHALELRTMTPEER